VGFAREASFRGVAHRAAPWGRNGAWSCCARPSRYSELCQLEGQKKSSSSFSLAVSAMPRSVSRNAQIPAPSAIRVTDFPANPRIEIMRRFHHGTSGGSRIERSSSSISDNGDSATRRMSSAKRSMTLRYSSLTPPSSKAFCVAVETASTRSRSVG